MTPLVVLGTFVLLAPFNAWAFSAQGHELVADVAELRLQQDAQGQAVLARIKAILVPGETMARASTWADRIKESDGKEPVDEDTSAFLAKVVAKFGNTRAHSSWHYVDVPFLAPAYSRQDAWTRPDDVVQMLRICAQTLRAGAPPSDAPIALSQREALRLLIHYVGDEHQPLHVGSGYIVPDGGWFGMPTTQSLMMGRIVDDQGGNTLTIVVNGIPVLDDRGKPKKLHSYWDFDTVHNLLKGQKVSDYAPRLSGVAPQSDWDGIGDMKYWAKQWADDSVHQARQAYRGVTLSGKNEKGWNITLPTDYDQTSADLIQIQLAKGGYRLAQILKAALGTP